MSTANNRPRLVADIGGTNARFALAGADGQPYRERVLAASDYPDIVTAITAYLESVAEPRPTVAALAVAMPITSDWLTMTNNEPWSFSIEATRRALGLERLILLNDFTALALVLPRLEAAERHQVGGGLAVPEAPIGLIGPGTGLGVSGLVWSGRRWIPLQTEGGHVTFSPTNEREWEVSRLLHQRFGHVSTERVLSGPGLVNVYQTLAELDGRTALDLEPAVITARALAGDCPSVHGNPGNLLRGVGRGGGQPGTHLGRPRGRVSRWRHPPALGGFFRAFGVSCPL